MHLSRERSSHRPTAVSWRSRNSVACPTGTNAAPRRTRGSRDLTQGPTSFQPAREKRSPMRSPSTRSSVVLTLSHASVRVQGSPLKRLPNRRRATIAPADGIFRRDRLLYQSDASGRAEIYVRRYPALDRQWQVSEGGGVQARWSRNNREIYYRGGGRIVAVSLDASGAEPVLGKPTALFTDDYNFGGGASIANYDVTPDGRFIMIRRGASGGQLHPVGNWTEELKRVLAT